MNDISLEEMERRSGFDQPTHEPDRLPTSGEPRPLVIWFGDAEPAPPAWLIRGILPVNQVAILAGQFSSGKTFVGIDISLATMTGENFLDCDIVRPGAVLWLAAEGRDEVLVRMKAAALHRTGSDMKGKLPFAIQAEAVPSLTEPDAFDKIRACVWEANAVLGKRFDGACLSLIVIDTLSSAAGFQDENSASETQRVFNTLRRISDTSAALVLLIDHYGKMVETGVRGSSAKGSAADAILAVLADKDADGKVDNRRVVIEKLRQAPTGRVMPFSIVSVPVDEWGNKVGAIEWQRETISQQAVKAVKLAWNGSSKVLKSAIERAMIESGAMMRPFGSQGSELKCVLYEQVRIEFYKSYAADTQEAKRMQFKRLFDKAAGIGLIASREIGGSDWMWFVKPDGPDTDSQNT